MSDRSEQAFREAFVARAEALHPQPLLPLPERSRRRWPVMVAVAAVIVPILVGVFALWPSGERMPTPADVTDDPGTEPKLGIMEGAPAELPPWASEADGLPVRDWTRVADVDHLSVFASRDDEGQWCVVLAIEPTRGRSDWVAGASCARSERFATDGVRVEVALRSERWGGALLLPDDFDGEIGDDWERVNDNLAVRQ